MSVAYELFDRACMDLLSGLRFCTQPCECRSNYIEETPILVRVRPLSNSRCVLSQRIRATHAHKAAVHERTPCRTKDRCQRDRGFRCAGKGTCARRGACRHGTGPSPAIGTNERTCLSLLVRYACVLETLQCKQLICTWCAHNTSPRRTSTRL